MTTSKSWKRDRQNLFRLFLFNSFLTGVSVRLYHQTEFFYFRDNMQVANPEFFYGLSATVLSASTAISVLIGSFYYDATRDYRTIGIMSALLDFTGNIIYMLGFSPYLVLFGNFVIGMGQLSVAAGLAELFQVYENEKLTRKMFSFLLVALLGSLISPCIIFAFDSVDVVIGAWRLNVNNIVALIMAALYLISFTLRLIFLKNISLKHNIKKERKRLELEEEKEDDAADMLIQEEILNKNEERSAQNLIGLLSGYKELLTNYRILFLYLIDFFQSFISMTLLLLLSLKGSQYLSWKQGDIARVNLISRVIGSIPFFLIIVVFRKKLKDVLILITSITSSGLAIISLLVIPYTAKEIHKAIMFYVFNIFTMVAATLFQTINRTMIAKRAPYEIQGRAESVRFGLFQLGVFISGLTIDIFAQQTTLALILTAIIPFTIVILLVLYYKKYNEI